MAHKSNRPCQLRKVAIPPLGSALRSGFYFLTFISGSVLVYDALGQELTNDYLRRGQLFALKAFLGMLGAQRPSPSP